MVPINHMVAVKTGLLRERPETVRELYRLLQQSKQLGAPAAGSTPDLTPFGIEANRRALDLLLRYSHRQGLIPRLYTVEKLFDEFIHATQG